MNSNETDLQSCPTSEQEKFTACQNFRTVVHTSILRPRFQAEPVILLATTVAWKHLPCPLASFHFTKKAYSTHYIHVGLTLLFTNNIFRGVLCVEIKFMFTIQATNEHIASK